MVAIILGVVLLLVTIPLSLVQMVQGLVAQAMFLGAIAAVSQIIGVWM